MFNIKDEIKKLPNKPGVYIMKDNLSNIIYIGKAINLKKRVRQYFSNNIDNDIKVFSMVKNIVEFEYIITDTEMEALILECNLIKMHKPRYNIMLKDDKTYPYIKITLNEDFPRIFITRKFCNDKAKYFGPITNLSSIKEIVDIIHKIFPIRKCNKIFPKDIGKERPCLDYHIGMCLAPCNNLISKEEYRNYIYEAIMIIEGKHNEIIKKMSINMEKAAKELDFEKAAILRDNINILKNISLKQKMSNTGLGDCDVIAFDNDDNNVFIQVFFIRAGKMIGKEDFFMNDIYITNKNKIITDFVKQFYSGTAFIPKEIIVQYELFDNEKYMIEEYFSKIKGSKVVITNPLRGNKLKIVELAYKNANISLKQLGNRVRKEYEKTISATNEICDILNIDKITKNSIFRIESYDISNIQGFNSVGSMVVFENGQPKKSDYRKFRIKTVLGLNDYESIKEIVYRRFQNMNLKNEKFLKLPNLIMVDGGKIQVNAVKKVLQNFNLDIPVCGMIKDDKHKTKGIIYNNNEINIDLNSEAFFLIKRIQDEVHRFAIEYHKNLHNRKTVHSILDDIKGIGEKRKKSLIKHFGSIEKIKNAEVLELIEADYMTIKAAESIYSFFRSK